MRFFWFTLAFSAAVFPLVAYPLQQPATPPAAEVELLNNSTFNPTQVTVKVGERVRWQNVPDRPFAEGTGYHTILADDESFGSLKLLQNDDSYEFSFTQPGTYPYYCTIHGDAGGVGMSGIVVVLAEATAVPSPTPEPLATPSPSANRIEPLFLPFVTRP